MGLFGALAAALRDLVLGFDAGLLTARTGAFFLLAAARGLPGPEGIGAEVMERAALERDVPAAFFFALPADFFDAM
jgi:hypothetical protein